MSKKKKKKKKKPSSSSFVPGVVSGAISNKKTTSNNNDDNDALLSSSSTTTTTMMRKHRRVCEVALKRENLTSAVKSFLLVVDGFLTLQEEAKEEEEEALNATTTTTSPTTTTTTTRGLAQLLEKVLALCQLRGNANAVKKVLEKVERLHHRTRKNDHHPRPSKRQRPFSSIRLTNASLRCAYFTFCACGDANAAVEMLLMENDDDDDDDDDNDNKKNNNNNMYTKSKIEKTIEKIGAENLVRGCSFARVKSSSGGVENGCDVVEQEVEDELLWRVLKLTRVGGSADDDASGRNESLESNNESRKREMIAKMVSDGFSRERVRVEIRNRVELPARTEEEMHSISASVYNNNDNNSVDLRFVVCCEDDGRRRPANRLPLKLFRAISPSTLILAPACVLAPRVDRVDLSRTVGPGIFALTSVFTTSECDLFIRSALACGLVKDDENDQESMEYCEICVYNSVVENIWQRIRDHFHADEDEKIEDNSDHYWLPVGINPRFRIFKYDDKSVYRRHLDGAWPCGTLDERTNEFIVDTNALNSNKENPKATRLTFLIYLTDSFRGGETTFYSVDSDNNNNNHEKVIVGNAVVPRRGSVLCFPHGDAENSPVHEGSKLFSAGQGNNNNNDDNIHNCKFVVRTDVVFEKRRR
jgi:hypothetical protein